MILIGVLSTLAMSKQGLGLRAPPVPSWDATYNITRSTIIMPCNLSGYFDPEMAARFAVVDYDWSNTKSMWTNPGLHGGGLAPDGGMDTEERLVEQATMTKRRAKELGIDQKVWVYRNLVHAQPWFSTVRAKLEDPQYSGFFLRFDTARAPYHVPACDDAYTPAKCSVGEHYHDQTQSPQSDPHANCTSCGHCFDGPCDCGKGIPCGMYLWNHANGTMLREFIVETFVGGATGLANPNIDGLFLDDHWDNPGGLPFPSETEPHADLDMGLSPTELDDILTNWSATVDAVAAKLADAGGWSWQDSSYVYPGNFGNAFPKDTCAEFLSAECRPQSTTQVNVSIFTFTRTPVPGKPWPAPFPLENVDQDVAMFLLARGDYAYLGYGWQGCQCLPSDTYDGCLPHNLTFEFPALLERDYGEPLGLCTESKTRPGVFRREWSKASIEMDCFKWNASIVFK